MATSGKRLKQLITGQMLVSRGLKTLGKPVAWVTSGAPIEPLLAVGVIPFYPENHSAICAAKGMGAPLCQRAETMKYSRDLCSYFRVDLGSQDTGRSPFGTIPAPDLVVASNNICGTVQNWFRIIAERHGVPFFFIDTPYSDRPPTDAELNYVEGQLRELAKKVAGLTGHRFDEAKLVKIENNSLEALKLWSDILKFGAEKPAMFTSFEAFVYMYPIVTLRGTRWAVWFYKKLLNDIRQRQKLGQPSVPGERARVVWDNIALWTRHKDMRKIFINNGIALVGDTYTNAWRSDYLDSSEPFRSMARSYMDVILNHGPMFRVNKLISMIREYHADGFVLHSNRSCKRWSLGAYSVKKQVSKATGVPGLVIDGDMADPRAVSMDQVRHRLEPFFEMLTDK